MGLGKHEITVSKADQVTFRKVHLSTPSLETFSDLRSDLVRTTAGKPTVSLLRQDLHSVLLHASFPNEAIQTRSERHDRLHRPMGCRCFHQQHVTVPSDCLLLGQDNFWRTLYFGDPNRRCERVAITRRRRHYPPHAFAYDMEPPAG